MPNNSKPNITAATGRDAVFHTIPKPTVCYSESVILFRRLLVLVEIASRSIYMSAPTGDYYSEMIYIIRKIHGSSRSTYCARHWRHILKTELIYDPAELSQIYLPVPSEAVNTASPKTRSRDFYRPYTDVE